MSAAADNLAQIRRDYGQREIDLDLAKQGPDVMFSHWFEENLTTDKLEPTAMVLSTIDADGMPDSRVVLLKGVIEQHFVFYTNYSSAKGVQLDDRPVAALNFHWPITARQVRIRGRVDRLPAQASDTYFSQRPRGSQVAAIVSPQSQPVSSFTELEQSSQAFLAHHPSSEALERPDHWGGYALLPLEYEFWQGRDNRLHQRIKFIYQDDQWTFVLLAP